MKQHDRLHHPPPAVHDPDHLRHHAGVVRRGAVRARRAGGTRHRPALRHRYRRDLAHFRLPRRRLRRARRRYRAARKATSIRNIAARRASIPPSSRAWKSSSASTSRPTSAFSSCCGIMLRFDFGKSYFRDVSVLQLIKEKLPVSISLGIWMTLSELSDLDPARHPQGGARRHAVRRLDLERHHRRLRHSRISVRDPAHHPVRRRLVLADLSVARTDFRRLVAISLVGEDPRLFLAPDAADHVHGACRLRHHDAAHQKLLSRRAAQAICAHRARQRLLRAAGALRPHLPQRHAARHRRLSQRLRQRLLCRLAVDRDDLLARRARPLELRKRAQPRLSGGVRQHLYLRADRPGGDADLRPHLHAGSIRASISRRGRCEVDVKTRPDASIDAGRGTGVVRPN